MVLRENFCLCDDFIFEQLYRLLALLIEYSFLSAFDMFFNILSAENLYLSNNARLFNILRSVFRSD